MEKEEPSELCGPSSTSQGPTTHPDPVIIDSEESSLDSLPSIGLKARVLQKFERLPTTIDTDVLVDSKATSQELKSSQSSVSSKSDHRNNVPNIIGRTESAVNKDLYSNSAHQNFMLKTDSQDTNSQESSQNSIQSLSSVSSVASIQSLPKPDFVLRPGEFEIVLCVDNAEYYGV